MSAEAAGGADPDLVAQVTGLVRGVAGETGERAQRIGPRTRLDGDLFLDSTDLIALDAALRLRYGGSVDLIGHVARLGLEEIIALTVADVAAHVAEHGAAP